MRAFHFIEPLGGSLLTSPVELYYAPVQVQYHDQRSDGIQNGGNKIALLLQCFFRLLQLRDIERHPLYEPGVAVVAAHHLGFAMKPDHVTVARDYAVNRSQRLAGEEHVGGFLTPTQVVFGMDVPVPAHRILQPLGLREPQRGFYVWTDISLADSAVQVNQKHYGRKLF